MCGIAAFFQRSSNQTIESETLARALSEISHRGPDGQGQWISKDRKVHLGHARLSIIDLEGGAQPLLHPDRDLATVVNGELYDYEGIRKRLAAEGHNFRTQSDSEIVLPLYERFGPNFLNQIRGEFSIVVWDGKQKNLFAARDRFGIKPLFYSIQNGALFLASEIKALFQMGVPACWDNESVHQFHTGLLPLPGRTLFKGVFQVPPGHYLIATENDVRLIKYWDFNYPTAEKIDQNLSVEEAAGELKNRFEKAVQLRMRADVPVACYLSGGLDSCAVLGIAARQTGQRIRAFTLGFDHVDYDETKIAEEMARHAGAEFCPIQVREQDVADNFCRSVWHAETPFTNTHGIAKLLLSRKVREAGYKVVLTGEGSDEIFAGYPHFRRDVLLYNRQGQDPSAVEALLQQLEDGNQVSKGLVLPIGRVAGLESLKLVLGFVPSFVETFVQTGSKMAGILSPYFRQKFEHRSPFLALLSEVAAAEQLTGRDAVNQSMYLWSKTALCNYILCVLGDRMEMANSVEGRVPFLDHHLVEWVVQLPISMKIRGMTEKFILREAVKPFITDTVYRRQKHPFLAPPSTVGTDSPVYALMQDTLRGAQGAALPFYDTKVLSDLLDRLPKMTPQERALIDPLLVNAMSFAFLQDRFHMKYEG